MVMDDVVVTRAGSGERLAAGPTVTEVKVPGSATGGRFGVVEMHLQAGWSGPPAHVHDLVEHCWYVLAGRVTLTLDGHGDEYGPGDCLLVPAGTSHAFSTLGGPAARVLQVDRHQALDGYLRDLVEAFPPGAAVDPVRVGEIMRAHDTRVIAG